MKKYWRNSIVNLLFNYSTVAYNLVAGLILVPMYLTKIDIQVYGSFLAASTIALLIGQLEFGLSMVLTQHLSEDYAKNNFSKFRRTVYSGICASTILFVLICMVTIAILNFIPLITNVESTNAVDLSNAFLILGISAAFSVYVNTLNSLFQAMLKPWGLGIINLVSSFVGLFTILATFNIYGSLWSIASGALVRTISSTVMLAAWALFELYRQKIFPKYSKFTNTKQLMYSCIPIFIGGTVKSLAENTQYIIIANTLSPGAVAILYINVKAMQLCSMLLTPIGSSIYAATTHVRHKLEKKNFDRLRNVAMEVHAILAGVLIGFAVSLNYYFISVWLGPDKFSGQALTFLLGASYLIVNRFSFYSFLTYAGGSFKALLRPEINYALLRIILCITLIPSYGIIAVPIADAISGLIFYYLFGIFRRESPAKKISIKLGAAFMGWADYLFIAFLGFVGAYYFQFNNVYAEFIFISCFLLLLYFAFVFVYHRRLGREIRIILADNRAP